ncbi:MAG: metallopeptidase [Eubacterium sp.]|nr:metallopeptidase [Eubacterium sp.]
MARIQTQSEWETEMAEKIFTFIRHELYLDLRFLEPALLALTLRPANGLLTFAADGRYLYVSLDWLIQTFRKNTPFLDRAYLHTVFHCMFRHLWLGGGREKQIWHIACDIAVERVIDSLDKSSTRRVLSLLRRDTYGLLSREEGGVSAAVIYRWLRQQDAGQLSALAREFYTDDHRFWPKEEDMQKPLPKAARQEWDQRANQAMLLQNRRGDNPAEGEKAFAAQIRAGKARRSYADFLRKFAVIREEARLDPEEFDVGYYSYGLTLYGRMPLIEPLETKESCKIQDFVIVIDTSYSTSGELVEGFLKETSAVLSGKDMFFGTCSIRVIQCDDKVRADQTILAGEGINSLPDGLSVVGGGGTDFRPAFSYVEKLREAGELKHLKGLLYFTDGKGTYPVKKPDYKTAFLFLGDYEESAVPPWAMRLRLEPEEWMK